MNIAETCPNEFISDKKIYVRTIKNSSTKMSTRSQDFSGFALFSCMIDFYLFYST